MIYKGKEAVIREYTGKEGRFFIYSDGQRGEGIYLSNAGEWGRLEFDDGWWSSREEAEAFLMLEYVG